MRVPLFGLSSWKTGLFAVLAWPADVPKKQPVTIPSAGYVTNLGNVWEYVGRTVENDKLVLHNVTVPKWVISSEPDIALNAHVEFLITVRDFAFLEFVKRSVLMRYYEKKMMESCSSDEDRSFYSQMLSFYASERDKSEKMLRRRGTKYTSRVLFREPTIMGCC
jgi:hypothetical protein